MLTPDSLLTFFKRLQDESGPGYYTHAELRAEAQARGLRFLKVAQWRAMRQLVANGDIVRENMEEGGCYYWLAGKHWDQAAPAAMKELLSNKMRQSIARN